MLVPEETSNTTIVPHNNQIKGNNTVLTLPLSVEEGDSFTIKADGKFAVMSVKKKDGSTQRVTLKTDDAMTTKTYTNYDSNSENIATRNNRIVEMSKNFKQVEIADMLGVSQPLVSKVLKEHKKP